MHVNLLQVSFVCFGMLFVGLVLMSPEFFAGIHGVNVNVCQLLRYKSCRLTLFANMPVSDEGEGDDRESGGGLFVPVLRKPRKKVVNGKRTNTSSPYRTRPQ